MQLQREQKLHKLFSMKARTDLLLTILVALLSVPASTFAADETLPPTTSLPDNQAQAKARTALNEPAPAAQPVPEPETIAPARTEPAATPTVTAEPRSSLPILVGPQPDTEVQAEARAALRSEEPAIGAATQPIATVTSHEPEPVTEAPIVAVAQPEPKAAAQTSTTRSSAKRDPRLVGLEPPPLPISAAQQQQLDQLLQQYRGNEITPAEYHSRRAEILAGK